MWWLATLALGADIVVSPASDLATELELSQNGDRLVLLPGNHTLDRYVFVDHDVTIRTSYPGLATVVFGGDVLTVLGDLTLESIVLDEPTVECTGLLTATNTDVRNVFSGPAFYVYGTALLTDVRSNNVDTLVLGQDIGYGTPDVTATLLYAVGGDEPLIDVFGGNVTILDAVLVDRNGLVRVDVGTLDVERVIQQGYGSFHPVVSATNATVNLTDLAQHDDYPPWLEAQASTVVATRIGLDSWFSPAAFDVTNSDLTLSDSDGQYPENLVQQNGGSLAVDGVTLEYGYGFPGLFALTNTDAVFTGLTSSEVSATIIDASGGSVDVQSSVFSLGYDSAISVRDTSLTVGDSHFEGNRASSGGYYYYGYYPYYGTLRGGAGVQAVDSTVDLYDLVLVDNTGPTGGAVQLSNTTGTVQRVWACGNEADEGGALWADGPVDVSASAFRGNVATGAGGALALATGTATHVTLVDNQASDGAAFYGSGTLADSVIVDHGDVAGSGGLSVDGNLWWDNTQPLLGPLPASELQADPYLVHQADCGPFMAIPTWGTAGVDAGMASDLDGSAADLGSVGGPDADPALWADDDGDGVVAAYDCDDGEAAVGGTALRYLDGDGDGFGGGEAYAGGCPLPDDAVEGGDCDDASADRAPGLDEVAGDGIDQDCDGVDRVVCYTDDDGDGFGTDRVEVDGACGDLARVDGDCDDGDEATYPGAADPRCDGINADCGPQPLGGEDDDGDGLTWEDEQALGTSDCDQDSDGDGVSDGVEVEMGSDPAEGVPGMPGGDVEYRTKTVPSASEPSYGCGCSQVLAPAGALPALGLLPFLLGRRRR